MDEDAGICILCDKPYTSNDKTRQVQQQTIKNYIQASIRRQDGKHLKLRRYCSITVHESCAKTYTNEPKILAQIRKLEASTSPETRSVAEFDFKNRCFICGEDASDIFIEKQKKYSAKQRNIIRMVQSSDAKQTLLNNFNNSTHRLCITVISRITPVTDLKNVGARYHDNCNKELYNTLKKSNEIEDSNAARAAKFISEYILANREECQFSIKAILKNFDNEEWASMKYIKKHLFNTFGNDNIIIHPSKDGPILTFTDMGGKILTENWYKKRKNNDNEERIRLVKTVSKIILEDIRSVVYDVTSYPAPDCFLENVNNCIPETLKILLDEIILTNKSSTRNYEPKITSIAHAIITATRPRSFVSSIQVGLGSMLNKKYGSKNLIKILNSLGFCCTYEETQLFESSVLAFPQETNYDDTYMQFVFDNADHNINTIDGRNTFHAMGGIQILTPQSSVSSIKTIDRLSARTSSVVLGKYGKIDLEVFHKPSRSGMKNIIVQDLNKISPLSLDIKLSKTDFLWIFGKHRYSLDFPGWNGFMESITKTFNYEISRITFLPFVNAPPSNYDTIYTVLQQARIKSQEINQKHTFVTFDQPLYYKAREILECCEGELSSVIAKLGGFHLLMSFMSAIGFIMNGSGLKELFCKIFAENSVDKILNGHAYSRAVRGHILTHLALGKIMLSSFDLTDNENRILDDKLCAGINTLNEINDENYLKIYDTFLKHVEQIKQRGPTAKLWLQYFDMVTIMRQFIEAEKMGNWNLHLESIRKMLPFFHASGRYLYAKSCQLYLQDMLNLEQKMDPLEYEKYTKKGFFTIRRSDKFWSGIWSDMSIEQVLMRSMKSSGGLTHGRGITDSVLSKWILTMPFLVDISNLMQTFCNVSFATSEQHVDARPSRIKEDTSALTLLLDFFSTNEPFPVCDAIVSLSTGIKGTEKINCHNALEVGLKMMDNIVGNNFSQLKFQRKDRVVPLQDVHCIKIRNEDVSINPTLIFQRIAVAMEGKTELKDCFAYELAPYPLSIFDNGIMRKTEKSKLYDYFQPIYEEPFLQNCIHIIDGGFLLHKVVWPQKESYNVILDRYVSYVEKYYAPNSFIIFDGYPENLKNSTKGAERQRRQARQQCTEIQYDLSMNATVSQEKFFSNEKNKNRFIFHLCQKLEASAFRTKQAYEDADVLIVETAINATTDEQPAVIIAEDIDVLVILTIRVPTDKKVYFLKPSRGKTAERLYDSNTLLNTSLKPLIGFIHAFSGCDTTSAFYKQGKGKIIKLLESDSSLINKALIFNTPCSTAQDIENAGQTIISAMYSGKKSRNLKLSELRYLCFKNSSTKKAFNLAMLPPTESAATQHSFRVYFQVQQYLGNTLDPTQWGWEIKEEKLQPIYTNALLVPENILRNISCKCAKGCTKTCSCVKHGLKCSDYCAGCHGQNCKNSCDAIKSCNVELEEPDESEINIDKDDELELNIEIESPLLDDLEDDPVYESDNDDDELIVTKKRKLL